MRTKEEIKNWLEKQPWFKNYVKNIYLLRLQSDPSVMERFISGSKEEDTIGAAFIWDSTNEGYGFWACADKEFRNWYKGEVPFSQLSVEEEFYLNGFKCKKISAETYVLKADIRYCSPGKLVSTTQN